MIKKEQILKTARKLVQSRGLEMKIYGVREEEEAVVIYFTSKKRVPLKDFSRDLEFEFNLPMLLKQIPRKTFGKIGQTKVFSEEECCAPLLRHCPFQNGYGCGYGFVGSMSQRVNESMEKAPQRPPTPEVPPKPPKKKKRKMIRRLVIG